MPNSTAFQKKLSPHIDVADVYQPRPAVLFKPQRIIQAKGIAFTSKQRRLVDIISDVYQISLDLQGIHGSYSPTYYC